MILHICSIKDWEEAKENGVYKADSLSTQGFIHCSTPEQVIEVADYVFKGQSNLILLLIDENKVDHEIKYEDAGNGKLYPHIYGPLNIEAVLDTRDFPADAEGNFKLPNLID
jgi:uncharacterized protein (DUF952 family)